MALPLKLLFKTTLEEGTFPEDWKKSNVVTIHKKESKNLIKNYRLFSLFPIFSKILERLIFNSMFNFFRQNNLFTKCQSGFIPGDSCVAQLLSITHEIYQSYDCNPTEDVKGLLLNISKAFDKVWHEGLLFTLQSYGVEGNLLRLLKNYFNRALTKSCFKLTNFIVAKCNSRCSARLCFRTSFISYLYK